MLRILVSICIFFLPLSATAGQSVWSGVERTVAVGDVHGDFDQFVAVLRSASLIDSELQWTGGKTHLVQMGDMIDRGADTRKVLDLLMQLEGQAQAAGGAVHALIGNHEAMNIYGDLRYVSPESYETFHDGNSEKIRDVFYQRHLKELAADPESKGGPIPNAADREAWDKEHPLGYFESRYFFGPNGRYGKWIQQHNTVIQINGTIFCHAGISPKYADMDFNTINERVRAELQDFSKLDGGIVRDEEGPLWYRGWAKESETVLGDDLNRFLESHGAQRMVIGHTPTDGAVIPRFSGRILMVDVGLSAYYGSRLACLVIDDDVAFALHRGKKLEIPTEPGLPLLQYLKKAAALDPPPSPLLPVIEKIEEQISVPSP